MGGMKPPAATEDGKHSLFFYGTLMHQAVLSRVIGTTTAHLTVRDAILDGHSRHHVEQVDYPAVVEASVGAKVLKRELSSDEASVRGTLVQGLTDKDVAYLDEFEGDEYVRAPVTVNLISSSTPTHCNVYLWIAPVSRLSPSLWSYNDFLNDKLQNWVGTEGEKEYLEVDRRRAMGGIITPPGEQIGVEAFGKEFGKKYWQFEEGWINLNHGSYGAAPSPVVESYKAIQRQSSLAPDRFMRIEYAEMLVALRGRLGNFVGCDRDDIVMVNNATTGINAVLHSLDPVWEKNDKLLFFSTTIYNACDCTLQFIIDTHPHLSLQPLPIKVEYPISHSDLIQLVKKTIEVENAKGNGTIRLALIDAISSNPGVVVPWEELTKVLKENSILSLIDAAHMIGQLPVTLNESQPDFWVSNCHKWLMGQRGCAVLYVAKQHQHLIHSLPIGHSYAIRKASKDGVPGWVTEFEWNGTIDWSPLLSVDAALEFREKICGGEERITQYCHDLAVRGGEIAAEVLGTRVLKNERDEDGQLIANMVNVQLPLKPPPSHLAPEERLKILSLQRAFIYKTQIEQYRTIAPSFIHSESTWVRFSAQVYNDADDFRKVALTLKEICEQVNGREW